MLVALTVGAGASAAQSTARDSSAADRMPEQRVLVASTDPELEAKTRAVASQLRCPVCQGLSVQDSPSELAQEMKAVVREKLAAGKSEQQVKDFFIAKYGEWVLLQPEASGFNLFVYVLPWVALLAGAGLVVTVVRRWTATGKARSNPDAHIVQTSVPDADGRPPV